MSATHDRKPHVVIVGAGFGGLYAAKALRRDNVRVTVVDRRNHHLFQPLLYQVATAALSPGDIAYPIRSVLRKHRNTRVLLDEAVAIDLPARKVELRSGTLDYDYLILATGSRYAYFGHDDWSRRAPGLKSLEDALEIRRRILLAFERAERETDQAERRRLLTFVVIGGGPTGVELAGAIAEIACHVMVGDFRSIDPRTTRVVLVEAGPRILSGFPEKLSDRAEASLRTLGVEVMKGSAVSRIGDDEVQLGDEIVPAATTLWAAGVESSPLGRSLGVPLDRAERVLVEPDLSVPGHKEAFVIGDLAAFLHQTGAPLPGIAPVAMQQGKHAAKNISKAVAGRSSDPFHYTDKGNLATIGRKAAVADLGWLRISGFLAWVVWLLVHILYLIGFRSRLAVMLNWAWSYFTLKRPARLITGDLERGAKRRTDHSPG